MEGIVEFVSKHADISGVFGVCDILVECVLGG
jgi:hypothetical protein